MFLNPHEFPLVAELEANWKTIQSEMLFVSDRDFIDWQQGKSRMRGKWTIYGFFTPDVRWHENCARCPSTVRILDRYPEVTGASYSRLVPHSHIKPHRGRCGAIFRLHLPLVVPEGCKFRLGTETVHWVEGKSLVFDDTVEHEAFNESEADRTVLLVDFYRPWRHRNSALGFVRDRALYGHRQRGSYVRKSLIELTTGKKI